MIELVPIDSQLKLQTATEIQHRIFTCKGYDAYLNYKESVELYRCAEDPVSFQYDLMVYSKPLPGYAPEQQESTSSDPVCETATPYKK